MKKVYKQLIALAVLLVLFVAWTLLVVFDVVDAMDEAIVEGIVSFRGEKGGFWYWLVRSTTELAYIFVVIPAALIVVIFYKANTRSLALPVSMGVMFVANKAAKALVHRERPLADYHWMHESSYSYPSGHTTSAVVFYGMLAYLVYRSNLKKSVKITLITVLSLTILWIGFTRMVLSVHFFSDIIGGLIFGSFVNILVIMLAEMAENKGFEGLTTIINKFRKQD